MHLVSSKIEFEIKSIFRFKLLDKLLFDLGLWTKVEDDKRTIRQALKRFFGKLYQRRALSKFPSQKMLNQNWGTTHVPTK